MMNKKESVFERLNLHQTISKYNRSKYVEIKRYDYLDFILTSTYNHCQELFPEKEDYLIQPETKSKGKWGSCGFINDKVEKNQNTLGHPIKFGGVKERNSPHSVKLMNSGHHSAMSASGFSRQPFGGFYYY